MRLLVSFIKLVCRISDRAVDKDADRMVHLLVSDASYRSSDRTKGSLEWLGIILRSRSISFGSKVCSK